MTPGQSSIPSVATIVTAMVIVFRYDNDRDAALQEESAVYAANEPDPITGDLFQGTENALPAAAGRNSLRPKSGSDIDRSGARAVLAVREAPDTEGLYNVQAQLVTVGKRQPQVATVNSPEDAARIHTPDAVCGIQ